MTALSVSAIQVRDALAARGLETPMTADVVSREEKKEKIEYHMREVLSLLALDLTDDSLVETPHRIAKCMSMKFFQVWITPISLKLQ